MIFLFDFASSSGVILGCFAPILERVFDELFEQIEKEIRNKS